MSVNKGKITSYLGLFESVNGAEPLVKRIQIPQIQRDYAQGRDIKPVEKIREEFLDVLYDAIAEGNSIDLNFIYGNVNGDGVFEPLDGQQRLTTLFLLHIYLAHRAGKLDKSLPWTSFSYEIRSSARQFCKHLGENFEPNLEKSIREWIIDQSWYLPVWDHDPTIQSMLVMLDAIHECFKGGGIDWDTAWERLSDLECPAISFHFLSDKLDDSTALYITMNSRGKLLTDFENFKARFEQMLENICPERAEKFEQKPAEKFAQRVDQEWSNLLWRYRGEDNIIDDKFMRYFRFVSELCALGEGWKEGDFPESPKVLDDFELAKKVYGIDNQKADENINFLMASLDTWSSGIDGKEEDIDDFFDKVFIFNYASEVPPVDTSRVVITKPKWERERERNRKPTNLFEYACCNYGNSNKFKTEFKLYLYAVLLHRIHGTDHFQRRLRIVRNLIEASGINNKCEHKLLHNLIIDVKNIITQGELDNINGFKSEQVKEECNKCKLLEEHPELEKSLFWLEDNQLLKGCLVAFDLSPERFDKHASAFNRLFPEQLYLEKDKEKYCQHTAALLTIGDYSSVYYVYYGEKRFRLGSISENSVWRDLLTGKRVEKEYTEKIRKILGDLLDKLTTCDDPVKQQLDALISQWLQDREEKGLYDWRTYFLKYPEMRKGLSGRYVGGKKNYDICMLKYDSQRGYNSDTYLLAIYNRLCKDQKNAVRHPVRRGAPRDRAIVLEKSKVQLRNTKEGIEIVLPQESEDLSDIFSSFCKEYGLGEDGDGKMIGRVPSDYIDGVMVDEEDRVQIGADLLRGLVKHGL